MKIIQENHLGQVSGGVGPFGLIAAVTAGALTGAAGCAAGGPFAMFGCAIYFAEMGAAVVAGTDAAKIADENWQNKDTLPPPANIGMAISMMPKN